MKAEIVAIGTELLLGDIVNGNAAWLGRELADIGIDVDLTTAVGDNIGRISAAVGRACERADVVVLTTDNPRHEDPRAIAAEIWAGVPSARARWIVELDRARAIEVAIAMAGPTDVVVIAGKGHEQVQEISGEILPFSDAEVARATHRRRT